MFRSVLVAELLVHRRCREGNHIQEHSAGAGWLFSPIMAFLTDRQAMEETIPPLSKRLPHSPVRSAHSLPLAIHDTCWAFMLYTMVPRPPLV